MLSGGRVGCWCVKVGGHQTRDAGRAVALVLAFGGLDVGVACKGDLPLASHLLTLRTLGRRSSLGRTLETFPESGAAFTRSAKSSTGMK